MPNTNPCTECGAPVQARRPSRSGTHWCKKVLCQRERTAYYRKRSTESAIEKERRALKELKENHDNLLNLLDAVAAGRREACPVCKAPDAIPGHVHPTPEGAVCRRMVDPTRPKVGLPNAVVPVVWPRVAAPRKES